MQTGPEPTGVRRQMTTELTIDQGHGRPVRIKCYYDSPGNTRVELMYPTPLDSLTVAECPGFMDSLKIHCDQDANAWIITQQRYADQNNTGEWVEVARISGYGPGWIDT